MSEVTLAHSCLPMPQLKSFFDFSVVFNSEWPSISRIPAEQLRIDKVQQRNWKACLNYSVSGSSLASHLIHQKENGPWRLWLLGELYGYRDLEHGKGIEVLLDRFSLDLLEDRVAAATLNGHFLIFAWNEHSGEWHVWTNRLGTFHAYYATDGKRAALGSFFPAVAAAASRRQLDWAGLSGFFGFGFFPEDRTYFDDVRILRPATHSVFDENGRMVRQSRYWDWWYQPDRQRSFADTVAEFGETLKTILTDQTRAGKIAVPISSGLDSRTAAAVITDGNQKGSGQTVASNGWSAVRPRLWSYSYGYTDYSSETAIAARIAAARGLSFKGFTIPAYLFDRLELVLSSIEGFQGIASTRQAAIGEEIASNADYVIAAHWGDVWMDDMGLLDQDRLSDKDILDHALHKIKKGGRGWLLEHLCRPRLGREKPDDVLRGIVERELTRVSQIDEADFRLKAFKTEQWSFRWTVASLRMFQPGAFPRLPFYDNRMVDFCCTVPSKWVAKRQLQIEFLKRFHPDIARIPWDVTGNSLFYDTKSKSWELSKRAWRKMCRIVTNRPHVGRNWEVQFLNEKGKAGLHEWLLHPGLKIHEFVSIEAIKNLLDELFITPNAGNGYTVSTLLTFSAWLERYG